MVLLMVDVWIGRSCGRTETQFVAFAGATTALVMVVMALGVALGGAVRGETVTVTGTDDAGY